jgi:hypothetical protein
MLTKRQARIGWRAYLCEQIAMRRTEHPSEAEIEKRMQGYFRWRFEEAIEALPVDSSALAEVLSEMLAVVIGEEEIEGWQPPALAEVRARINGNSQFSNAAEQQEHKTPGARRI